MLKKFFNVLSNSPKPFKVMLGLVAVVFMTLGILGLVARGQTDLDYGYFNLSDAQATQNTKLGSNNVKDVFAYDSTGESWKTGTTFPDKANLVLTSTGLDIINADTNERWMDFTAGVGNILGSPNLGAATYLNSITAQNGKIYIGWRDSFDSGGLTILDFAQDKGSIVQMAGTRDYNGNFSTRNNGSGWGSSYFGYRLIADNTDGNRVKDVSAATVGGVGYVAVLTDGAIYPDIGYAENNGSKITILKEDVPSYSRYIENICPFNSCFFDFAFVFNKIHLASDGTLYIARQNYYRHASSGQIAPKTKTAPALLADSNALSGTGRRNLYVGPTNAFNDAMPAGAYAYKSSQIIASTINQSIKDIYATEGTSPTGNNTIYVAFYGDSTTANGGGVTQIKENKATPASSVSQHWAKSTLAAPADHRILKENYISSISAANTDGNLGNGDEMMWLGMANFGVAEIDLANSSSVHYPYTITSDIGVSSNNITSLSYGNSLLVGTSKMGANYLTNYTPGQDVIIPEGPWTKYPSNPVLVQDGTTGETYGVWQPSVIKIKDLGKIQELPDETGANNGVNYGATLTTMGKVGGALQFDGSNDYVSIPYIPVGAADSYTVEAWVKLTDVGGGATVSRAVIDSKTTTSNYPYQIYFGNGSIWYGVYNGITPFPNIYANTPTTAGQWYHIAAVRDAVNHEIRLYKDGAQVGPTVTDTTTTFSGTGSGGAIGRREINNDNYFNGSIDEVAVYKRALTQIEISGHSNGGTYTPTDYISYWKLDEINEKDEPPYKMWYSRLGSPIPNNTIGYVESTDGVNWTSRAQVQGLELTGYTTNGIMFPSVIKDDSVFPPLYKMWYIGYSGASHTPLGDVLYATSTDGINWLNPKLALPGGTNVQWDYSIDGTYVKKDDAGGYKMWYEGRLGGLLSIGYATSTDGINWLKHTPNPVFSDSTPRSPSIIFKDDIYHMWYSRLAGSKTEIAYATSPTGIDNWTILGTVLTTSSSSWESANIQYADVLYDSSSGKLKMWYSGHDSANMVRIGLATKQLEKIDISSSDQDNDGISDRKDLCPLLYQNNDCYVSRDQKIVTELVAGPEITTPDGNVSMDFASPTSEPITITGGLGNFAFSSNGVPFTAISNYNFQPEGPLYQDVTITMRYTENSLGLVTGTNIVDTNANFGVYYYDPTPITGGWGLFAGGNCSTIANPTAKDCTANTITFTTNHFSEFAIAGSLEGPVISSIDNNEPESSGGITPLISETPTFSGMANPNDTVSVYTQTAGTAPSITKVAGEDALSLTYIPYNPNNVFSDNFNSLNTQVWSVVGQPPEGSIAVETGQLKLTSGPNSYTSGASYRGAVTSRDQWQYFTLQDLNIVEADFVAPSWINSTASNKYSISLNIQSDTSPMGIMITSPGNTGNQAGFGNSCSGCTPTLPVPINLIPGNTYRLKIEYDKNTGTLKSYLDGILKVQDSNIVGFASTGFIGVSLYTDTPNIGDPVYFDNVSTNFAYPELYLMAKTGMGLDGVSYMDNIGPLLGSSNPIPGVLFFGASSPQALTILPGFITPYELKINYNDFSRYPDPQDIYAYLVTVDFGTGPLHFTLYDTATPEQFAQLVVGSFGGAMTVDGFAKALTYSGNNTYTSLFPPFLSQGRIIYNSTTMQAEIVSGGAVVETLLARAITDTNGYWTAFFGIDELGNGITELIGKTLLDIGTNPFTFIARTTAGGSLPVTASIPIPEVIVDTTPPITTATVTGITQNPPYTDWYKDTATVELTATDEEGGSGVLKTEYSLSGATTQTLTQYTTPFNITALGETIVTFYSTDNANNIETAKTINVLIDKDTDSDGFYNNFDVCDAQSGAYDGCSYAVKAEGVLQVQYIGRVDGYASIVNGKQKRVDNLPLKLGSIGDSRNESVTLAHTKLYKMSDLGATTFDQVKSQCAAIYNDNTKVPYNEKDAVTGYELLGVGAAGDYLTIERAHVLEPVTNETRFATTCKSVAAIDFVGNTAKSRMMLRKVVSPNGIQLERGDWTILTGSQLEITYPGEVLWENQVNKYVYVYTFGSDSEWTVNVCTYIPVGYQITGVYDELGNLFSTTDCVQTIIPGGLKAVAFEIADIGSPKKFNIDGNITATPKGKKAQKINIKTSTERVSGDRVITKNLKNLLKDLKIDYTTQGEEGPTTKEGKGLISRAVDYVKGLIKDLF